MEEVSIGELSRLLKIHMDESNKKHDRTYEKLEGQDAILNATLIQAQKTNGRVSSLEETRKDDKEKFQKIETVQNNLVNYKWWLSGIVAVVVFAGGSYFTLALNDAKTDLKKDLKLELTQGFEQLLDRRVKGVYLGE